MRLLHPTSILVAAWLLSGLAQAFPPAPYYTLYGTVRDQTGQVVRAQDAIVVLLKGTAEAGRGTISSGVRLDQNYEMAVRIDQARPATTLYSKDAVEAQGQFSLVVDIGGVRYLPIEVNGTLTAGKGGERVKLDLTLGEDSDKDGLPDAWEQWQLYQAGSYPDANGWDLTKLSKNGDFDKDGQTDYLEYLAGTFAGDATERFDMAIKSKTETFVNLEFFAITGKTYTIECSTDLKSWTRVPFSVEGATAAEGFTATSVGLLPVICSSNPENTKALYRLTVR